MKNAIGMAVNATFVTAVATRPWDSVTPGKDFL